MTNSSIKKWNPHYDFQSPASRAEIEKVDSYNPQQDQDIYTAGGGDVIQSPWGSNRTLDAGRCADTYDVDVPVVNPLRLPECQTAPQEFCIKELIVNPGFMLSLQRHRARQELWSVHEGTLTVILDGEIFDVKKGESVFIPVGGVHCMNNRTDEAVKVVEVQSGITREKDNIRLLDFSGRATYPLSNENEFRSAKLYAALQAEIVDKFGLTNNPPQSLL